MIFRFEAPHAIGSICGTSCPQCPACDHTVLRDSFNNELPDTPLFIVREATKQEWLDEIREEGGVVEEAELSSLGWFYEVSVD